MKNCLYCPLCKKELNQVDRTYKCENNHSYDISKKGTLNLLLANQHHSSSSGDEKEMILSRVRFLNTGHYNILRDLITSTLLELSKDEDDISIGDLGCGEGYYTCYFHETLQKTKKVSTYGIDLSKQAINECAIRSRSKNLQDILFIIGNLNYIPLQDNSLDFIVNSFAKIDENEFLRVLKKGGYFLRILPGSRHLLGLKEILYENVRLNEEKEHEIEGFTYVGKKEASGKVHLNNQEINDVFTMTPYYYKSPRDTSKKLMETSELDTEISFEILIYKKN